MKVKLPKTTKKSQYEMAVGFYEKFMYGDDLFIEENGGATALQSSKVWKAERRAEELIAKGINRPLKFAQYIANRDKNLFNAKVQIEKNGNIKLTFNRCPRREYEIAKGISAEEHCSRCMSSDFGLLMKSLMFETNHKLTDTGCVIVIK